MRTGWGFSALIETGKAPPLLFDTGADGSDLLYNMKKLEIDPQLIGIIVISHSHGDHTGGLASILKVNENAGIYVPESYRLSIPGRKINLVSGPESISEDVFTTGEIHGIEQSLAVKSSKGIVVVVGCSHPGVGAILRAAAHFGKLYGIVGGFHGFQDFNQLEGLSLICPCHCTQYRSEIKHLYPDRYVECGTGLEIEV